MAGGVVKYRHLSRDSAHRKALLRNLVTSLVKHESIRTSYAKAKETQRLAEKLITLAKRNNETSRRKATGILFVRVPPADWFPKQFWPALAQHMIRISCMENVQDKSSLANSFSPATIDPP